MGPFARRGGRWQLRIGETEAAVLARVAGEMRAVIQVPERPEHLRRLFPVAYPDDAETQAEFARLTVADLESGKIRALDDVDRALARGKVSGGVWRTTFDDEEIASLLGVLNDARLALGTRLDVTEEDDDGPAGEAPEDRAARDVYWWLGMLEEMLVEQLLAAASDE